ncbi:Ulp1 peptidase [Ranunculus cassubicifolius]
MNKMDLEDSIRCKRNGGGGWRCRHRRLGGSYYCDKHHVEHERTREKLRKEREMKSKDKPPSIGHRRKRKDNAKPKGKAKIEAAAPDMAATKKKRGRKRKTVQEDLQDETYLKDKRQPQIEADPAMVVTKKKRKRKTVQEDLEVETHPKDEGQLQIEAGPAMAAIRKKRGRKRKTVQEDLKKSWGRRRDMVKFADIPDSDLGKGETNQLKGIKYIDLDLEEEDHDTETTPNENRECFLQMPKEGDDDKDIDPIIKAYISHKAQEVREVVDKSISENVDHLKDMIVREIQTRVSIQCSFETPSDKKIAPFFKRCLEQWKFKYLSSLIESYMLQSKESLKTEMGKIGAFTLHREDLVTLSSPTGWLSAGVIEAYGTIITEISKNLSKDRTPTVHIVKPLSYTLGNSKNGYNVKFSDALKDFASCSATQTKILIPVNLCESHWGLLVVDINAFTFTVFDSKFSSNELGYKYKDVTEVVARHLPSPSEGKQWETNSYLGDLSKQSNDYDCGIFVLSYMECIARGISFDFGKDVSGSRVVICSDLLDYILKGSDMKGG